MNSLLRDRAFWLLLVFASLYIVCNIGTGSLTTWDECCYMISAKEMAQENTWYTLTVGGKPFLEKPPLYMWCTAVFYKIFGVNEFTSRLTSGIFGIATVMLVYIFGKYISDKRTGFISAIVLLGLPHYLHFAKMAMLDVTLTFFITVMIYLFLRSEEDRKYLFYCALVFGLAYLTKGFAAFLGLFVIGLYSLFTRNLRLIFSRYFLSGILISVSCILLWYFMQYRTAGAEAVRDYFGFHIFTRAMQAIEEHTGGINFYQKAIFNKNKPWSVLLYVSALYVLWQAVIYRSKKAVLISCWILTSYALYTFVRTKLHWYIMPVYPAMALAAGIATVKFIRGRLFYAAAAVFFIIIFLQIPFSWAFKLDFSPDVKQASLRVKQLYDNAETVYFYGGYDNKELFYLNDITVFVPVREAPLTNTEKKKIRYVITRREGIKGMDKEFGPGFKITEDFDNLALLKRDE